MGKYIQPKISEDTQLQEKAAAIWISAATLVIAAFAQSVFSLPNHLLMEHVPLSLTQTQALLAMPVVVAEILILYASGHVNTPSVQVLVLVQSMELRFHLRLFSVVNNALWAMLFPMVSIAQFAACVTLPAREGFALLVSACTTCYREITQMPRFSHIV
jgi:hypothetical protein